jgi:hypothetical protein
MEVIKLLVLAGIFFALTPGILVKLPFGGSVLKVAAAHAILFGLVYLVGTHFFQSLEGFITLTLGADTSKFFPEGITAAAARNGYSLLASNNGLLPTSFFPNVQFPKCPSGRVIDATKPPPSNGQPLCIPLPTQYLLPVVSGKSVSKTPDGGGWLYRSPTSPTSTQIFSIGTLFAKKGTMSTYCPPGYVFDSASQGGHGGCTVAPETAVSYINGTSGLPPSPYA